MKAKHIVDLLLEVEDITPDEIFKASLTALDYMKRVQGHYEWVQPIDLAGATAASLRLRIVDHSQALGYLGFALPEGGYYISLAVDTKPKANGAGASHTLLFSRVVKPGSDIDSDTMDRITRLFHKIEDLTASKWKNMSHLTKYAHALLDLPGIELQ